MRDPKAVRYDPLSTFWGEKKEERSWEIATLRITTQSEQAQLEGGEGGEGVVMSSHVRISCRESRADRRTRQKKKPHVGQRRDTRKTPIFLFFFEDREVLQKFPAPFGCRGSPTHVTE